MKYSSAGIFAFALAIGQKQQHAAADAVASTTADSTGRDLQIQHCLTRTADPTLGANCTGLPYAPLVCGVFECLYYNDCIANDAGFNTEIDCCPAVPSSGDQIACTEDYRPVRCGLNLCEYSNECIAKAAGYDAEDDCCPVPAEGIVCDIDEDPVVCKGCLYPNICTGEAAGYNPTTDCCPVPSANNCATEESLVNCDGCVYANQCNADAAGYAADECFVITAVPSATPSREPTPEPTLPMADPSPPKSESSSADPSPPEPVEQNESTPPMPDTSDPSPRQPIEQNAFNQDSGAVQRTAAWFFGGTLLVAIYNL